MRKRKKSAPIKRSDIEKLNQGVLDQQCTFLSKLNKTISRKLKGKSVNVFTKDENGEERLKTARVVHAYIEGDRLVVLDIEFDDKRVLVDYTYLAEND